MEVDFEDDDYRQLEDDPKFSGNWAQAIVSAYRRRMQQIRAAADERDLYALKSLHLEKLKGARSHQRSMRLNDQWRLIVEFKGKGDQKKVLIVTIEDYH